MDYKRPACMLCQQCPLSPLSPATRSPPLDLIKIDFLFITFRPPPPQRPPPRVATVQIGGDKGDIDALISTGGLSPPPTLLTPFNRSATSFINKLSLYNSLLCVL